MTNELTELQQIVEQIAGSSKKAKALMFTLQELSVLIGCDNVLIELSSPPATEALSFSTRRENINTVTIQSILGQLHCDLLCLLQNELLNIAKVAASEANKQASPVVARNCSCMDCSCILCRAEEIGGLKADDTC